jgi:hypothetical protein
MISFRFHIPLIYTLPLLYLIIFIHDLIYDALRSVRRLENSVLNGKDVEGSGYLI